MVLLLTSAVMFLILTITWLYPVAQHNPVCWQREQYQLYHVAQLLGCYVACSLCIGCAMPHVYSKVLL